MAKGRPEAQTALGPMVIAAVEQFLPPDRRVVDDDLATRFLPAAIMRATVRALRWRFARNLVIRMSERQAPGIWGSVLCRKRYADDRVAEALRAGVDQVVVLGAGFDTRAYRLVVPAGGRAFELDLPENVAAKRERLRQVFGDAPRGVALVPVDFGHDDLAEVLAAAGFDIERPAMFVWEAVTQYLSEEAARGTLAFLAKAAPGSRLIFTYLLRDFLDGVDLHGAAGAYRRYVTGHRIWRFGLAPAAVGPLLAEYGWAEREQVGPAEYVARYIRPTGRDLAPSEIERFVHAEKP